MPVYLLIYRWEGAEPRTIDGKVDAVGGERRCRRHRSQSRLPAWAARVSSRSVVSSTSVWNWKWKWMNDEGGNRRLWFPGYHKPKKKGLSGVLCYWLLITAAVETVRKSRYRWRADWKSHWADSLSRQRRTEEPCHCYFYVALRVVFFYYYYFTGVLDQFCISGRFYSSFTIRSSSRSRNRSDLWYSAKLNEQCFFLF